MSWAGSAISAILSLKYNRSLTSNSKAISYYKYRAREIRTTKSIKHQSTKSFMPKNYSPIEYERMKRRISTKVRSELLAKLGWALIVFMIIISLMTILMLKYPIDGYLFWAR